MRKDFSRLLDYTHTQGFDRKSTIYIEAALKKLVDRESLNASEYKAFYELIEEILDKAKIA